MEKKYYFHCKRVINIEETLVGRNSLSFQDLSIQTQSGNRLNRLYGKLLAMYML